VVDLSKIEMATEEDKSHSLDKWAALFKSTTKMKRNSRLAKDASQVFLSFI
jgi:hypothetical protein